MKRRLMYSSPPSAVGLPYNKMGDVFNDLRYLINKEETNFMGRRI